MNYYDYNYNYGQSVNNLENIAIWTIVSLILAIIGGVLVYFLFVKGKNLKLSPTLKKIRDLLDFKVMLIEPILKIVYLISTIFVILVSFSAISQNFLLFLLILILGPVFIRLIYEASLMLVMIWKNTKQISENTTPKAKEDKKEVEKKETEKKSTKKDEN